MNPPTTTSRFVRGRGRGGGAYRPYFYFRRNGKTIPAGGDPHKNGAIGPAFKWRGRRRRGGFSYTAQADVSNSGITPPVTDTSFLHTGNFAAPEDVLENVQSISIETNAQCPGWQLYFYKDKYDESSTIAKRIKAIEKHYASDTSNYNLMNIQVKRFFALDARIINGDIHIKEVWPDLMDDMQRNPFRTLATFGIAMFSLVTIAALNASISLQPCNRNKYAPRSIKPKKIYARPVNFASLLSFSQISTENLDKLVSVRGNVIAISDVNVNYSWICYKCSRCTQEQAMRQTGTFISRPYACKRSECHARKGFVEMRSSQYTQIRPTQIIHLARHNIDDVDSEKREFINMELRHDLVDCIKPGQMLTVTGVLKMRPLTECEGTLAAQRNKNCSAQIYLKATTFLDATHTRQDFTERDLDAIAAINGERDSLKLLVHSIAPEVHGQEMVKAGLLFSLFGGAGSQVHDESDINVLLVGDPGTGKSHMLQMCAKVFEKGNMVNGKGGVDAIPFSSYVQGRSQSSLSFGALTCSLNGHVTIDDIDRLASQQDILLQILETQCITLPFNGVFATETISSSIIASANPTKGHYDRSKMLTENIRISPSLSCQFHLVFVLSDKPDKSLDASLTEHIQKMHAGTKKSTAIASRYAMKMKTNNSINTHSIRDDEETEDESYNLADRLKLDGFEENDMELLPPILIKKFLKCARQQVRPLLNVSAAELLKDFYIKIRKDKSEEKSVSIASRLEKK